MPDSALFNTRLLVTTGPESAGKTTLARDLSRHLQVPLVGEQSRSYLNQLYLHRPAGSYSQSDLLAIARQQWQAEQDAMAGEAPSLMVCDTDLLVILVWSDVKYGYCETALLELFETSLQTPRCYLLCDPSMPWEADPLRENPHDRAVLLQRYITRLESLQLPWHLLTGTPEQRLQSALEMTCP